MPLALTIHPSSDALDMYNADSSSTFSLSGHISLALTSPSSLFFRQRTARVLLRSLTITFEGQSETLSPETGYAPLRLCSITRDLLPGDPIEFSNEGHEDADQPSVWNVVFDITVPGWLPTTSAYGDASMQATGTSYALYATTTFVDINHGHSPFSILNICGPVRSRTRTADAPRCPVTLRRFVEPQSASSSSTFPISLYIVDARREPDSEGQRSIPNQILDKIQVAASIPSAIAMDETSLPFSLHIHGKYLNESERKQLRITEFSVDVEQVEVYRSNLSRADVDRYLIPPQAHQPPRTPLRNPHPIHAIYNTWLLGTFRSSKKRSFSLLAPDDSGRYIVSGGGHIFDQDPKPSAEDHWYIFETKLRMFTEPPSHDWAGAQERRITENSPLFSVEHHLHVMICCEFDLVGGTTLEHLHFSLPMRHVNVQEVSLTLQAAENHKNVACTPILPAYSQLFHSNGERKLDYSIPLPLYEPPSTSAFMSDEHRF